ncbi:MAG: short-chain fatty acid transporter [Euryarchaeota archaeon]|nr:short-chain fatty acid transporter [Euryarchaeota archaeon]
MSGWLNSYSRAFQRLLPSPMAIALTLTVVAFVSALFVSEPVEVVKAWSDGLWNPGLMRFGFQAMFMLVLGHVLALSKPVRLALNGIANIAVKKPENAATYVAIVAMLLGWVNWGLGLVAGAIIAKVVIDKKVAHAGVVGAAGYMGLLVWHSGLSGSAPLKVAEPGHLAELFPKGLEWSTPIPNSISISETVFTSWNLGLTAVVMVAIAGLFYFLGRVVPNENIDVAESDMDFAPEVKSVDSIASFLDYAPVLSIGFGVFTLGTALWIASNSSGATGLSFVTPDWINLLLLGLALIAHKSIAGLVGALNKAIGGAAGILLQFPIYFGIMGVVTGTGLVDVLSASLVSATSSETLPLAIFTSSGILNVFVPSGGGQWAVQGPLILEACNSIGMSLEKGVMAMAYGDQWTNMLQPFWALPLLGITGLKAKDILPYTLAALLVSGVLFTVGLVLIV